jgi:hypothetical protein
MGLGIQKARREQLLAEIASKSAEVRAAQKKYFGFKSQTNLVECKRLERELDHLHVRLAGFEMAQQRRQGATLRQLLLGERTA